MVIRSTKIIVAVLLIGLLGSLAGPAVAAKDVGKAASSVAYNVYYGQLHSHSGNSDGSGTPAQAYQYARDTAGLDFFSLADHCSYPYPDGMTDAEYSNQISVANSYNDDGTYVTFYGFEWTSDTTAWGGPSTLLGKGHVTIINSPDMCEATDEATNDINELVNWMSTRDCIGFFNHPGQYNTTFDNFNFNHTDKMVGMEMWNRTTDYYGTGTWYHSALDKGWFIGAEGSQDNHSANWGTESEWRMAILAPELTRAALYEAMQERRFYSARDQNLVLSFTCKGDQMGSKISGGSLDVAIDASDGDNEVFSKIELLKNGSVIETWTPNSTAPSVSTTASGVLGDYFYVRVEQAGESGWRAISSPIFITSDGDDDVGVIVPSTAFPIVDQPFTLTAPSGTGHQWYWSGDDGVVQGTDATLDLSLLAADAGGVYSVTYETGSAAQATAYYTLTVLDASSVLPSVSLVGLGLLAGAVLVGAMRRSRKR